MRLILIDIWFNERKKEKILIKIDYLRYKEYTNFMRICMVLNCRTNKLLNIQLR